MSTSNHQLCLEAIHTDVQALVTAMTIAGLGITTGAVYKRKLPTDRNIVLATGTPACIVVSYPVPCTVSLGGPGEGGTNERESLGLPVQISAFLMEQQDLEINADSDTITLWMEKLLLRYQNKRPFLATVSNLLLCRVEPGVFMETDHLQTRNTFAACIVVRSYVRLARI